MHADDGDCHTSVLMCGVSKTPHFFIVYSVALLSLSSDVGLYLDIS